MPAVEKSNSVSAPLSEEGAPGGQHTDDSRLRVIWDSNCGNWCFFMGAAVLSREKVAKQCPL